MDKELRATKECLKEGCVCTVLVYINSCDTTRSVPHKLMYLMQETGHWGPALGVHILVPLPGHPLCFMFVVESMMSQLSPPATRFVFIPVFTAMTLCLDGFLSPSGTIVKTNMFFCKLP